MSSNPTLIQRMMKGSLVIQIIVGIIAGIALATYSPSSAASVSFLGGFFVSALKAVAPILVFILVASSIANQSKELILVTTDISATPPEGILEVLNTLLFKIVDNPVNALMTGNFIGILAWAVGLGLALQHANESTKNLLHDLAHGVSKIVHLVIRLAPLGIFGLVAATFAETGFASLIAYALYCSSG